MALRQTLDKYKLQKEFQEYDRDQFSIEGYQALIDYFEFGDIELDVIAICCEFSEDTPKEIQSNYNLDDDDNLERYLSNHTWHQPLPNGNIIYSTSF